MNTLTLCLLGPIAFGNAGQTADTVLKSRVIDASIFKSGIVMLTREVSVPAGSGKYELDNVPLAADGTFWYSSPDGLLVTDMKTTLKTTDETVKADAQTIGDYLAANVGHQVRLSYHTVAYGNPNKDIVEQIEGTVNGPPRANTNTVPLKMANGRLRNLALTSIEDIDTTGLKTTMSRTFKSPSLSIEFRTEAAHPSKLDFITLETGAVWTSSYMVTLKAASAATVVGKAQVALGRLSFDDTTVKALAGEPYMLANDKYDLSSGVGSLESYLSGSQSQFLSYHPSGTDPFTLLPQYSSDAAQARQWATNFESGSQQFDAYSYGRGYGGFGGGGGAGGGIFGGASANSSGYAAAPTTSMTRNLASQATTSRLESLYAYPLGKVTMQAGDRLSRLLFSQASTYESIFRWSTEVGSSDTTVKNLLRVHNTGTVPWTGGLVFVTKEDSPLAQLQMPFTPAGKPADLEMADAQDILVKKEESEVSRAMIPMPGRPKLQISQELNEAHLSVESTRSEPITFELTLLVPGEIADPNGGKVDKLLTRSDQWNRQSRITWSFTLGAGEKREFRMQFRHVG